MSPREAFRSIVDGANASLTGDEVLISGLDGEDSDFVRFNGASIRQAGSVTQRSVWFDLLQGRRHASASMTLSGDLATDTTRAVDLVRTLRGQVADVPDDPFLLVNEKPTTTEKIVAATLPDGAGAVDRILDASAGKDLVGVYASGTTYAGLSSSLGVEHWYAGTTFNLDWSYYLHGDKAAKNGYAGTSWDDTSFAAKVAWSETQLGALARKPIDLEPGRYRTYLAPAALQEVFDVLSWGGFGLKAHRTKTSPFLHMVTQGRTLHPEIRISEDIGNGAAPAFQDQGFARPDTVSLIHDGALADHLVSPRSAQEFGVETNGALDHESPVALSMAPGAIPSDKVLDELDTGIYIGNLWYLNFSDRSACRTTGMTRFATFWVQDGEIVAPINVLRYDDTTYNILGEHLVGLTDTAEVMLDAGTYRARSTGSSTLPGAVVAEMTFTL